MIITDNFTIKNKEFTKTYSDSDFYIERDNVKYAEAIDLSYLGRTYTETDEPIERSEDQKTDVEQKAEAYDYLTDRGDQNE